MAHPVLIIKPLIRFISALMISLCTDQAAPQIAIIDAGQFLARLLTRCAAIEMGAVRTCDLPTARL